MIEERKEKIVSIIVSHNSRIQCFLDKINPTKDNVKNRFKNGAILKLSLTKGLLNLQLVYSGYLSEKEQIKLERTNTKIYYVTDEDVNENKGKNILGEIKYPKLNNTNYIEVLRKLNLLDGDLQDDKEYIFYIIRHGQAQHNLKNIFGTSKTMGAVTDTKLSEDTQIQKTGVKLYDLLRNNNETISYFFVSDLLRSRETMKYIIDTLSNISLRTNDTIPIYNYENKKLFVLPCASEVNNSGSGGNCDIVSSNTNLSKFALENYSKCKASIINEPIENSCNRIGNIEIDWNIYLAFYSGYVRGELDNTSNLLFTTNRNKINQLKQHCRDTNMISMAFFIIKNNGNEKLKSNLELGINELHNFIDERKNTQNLLTSGGKRKTKRKHVIRFYSKKKNTKRKTIRKKIHK